MTNGYRESSVQCVVDDEIVGVLAEGYSVSVEYTAVVISLLKAQLDQWSDVLGLCFVKNVSNDPIANWKKIVYGDGTQLVGYEVQGGGHIPAFQGDATLRFIGFL